MGKENIENQAEPNVVQDLFQAIKNAKENSLSALSLLSSIAGGGNQEARDLINQIDQASVNGELALPFPQKDIDTHPKKLQEDKK